MPAVLSLPLEKKITLYLTDEDSNTENPDESTFVVVRQATQREVEKRAELTADASRIFREGSSEIEVKQRWSIEEQKRLEVYLTLANCNIGAPVSEEEKPHNLFKFTKKNNRGYIAMSEEEFNEAWGLLPAEWAEQIHEAVLVVNPQWNPNS